jgi:hypothetical protein
MQTEVFESKTETNGNTSIVYLDTIICFQLYQKVIRPIAVRYDENGHPIKKGHILDKKGKKICQYCRGFLQGHPEKHLISIRNESVKEMIIDGLKEQYKDLNYGKGDFFPEPKLSYYPGSSRSYTSERILVDLNGGYGDDYKTSEIQKCQHYFIAMLLLEHYPSVSQMNIFNHLLAGSRWRTFEPSEFDVFTKNRSLTHAEFMSDVKEKMKVFDIDFDNFKLDCINYVKVLELYKLPKVVATIICGYM